MTRFLSHTAAALAAVLLTFGTLASVVSVPPAYAATVAAPALA